jgi:DNA-directed RNA polymerase specialized sigma24 family protein
VPPDHDHRRFATTHWSLILAAADPRSPQAASALASLCEIYWFPVYAFIRRNGASTEDARDSTQAFFARVLEKESFKGARQDRGRFRAFLLTAVRHFLANQWDAARAQKRGGGQVVLPLEFDDGERRYLLEPADGLTPEHVYERRWALTVLDTALSRVAAKYKDADRRELFVALRPLLTGHEPDSYKKTARSLGMTEGALRVALHRLRRQFAGCLREVIGQTVERPEDVDEELQHLLGIVSR